MIIFQVFLTDTVVAVFVLWSWPDECAEELSVLDTSSHLAFFNDLMANTFSLLVGTH